MSKTEIIEELNRLEVLAKVYCDDYGPHSEEVNTIDRKIEKLNFELLDLMCPE